MTFLEDLDSDKNNATFVVAEISANHNSNKQSCLDLIDVAAKSGANSVKFQTYTPETLSLNLEIPDFLIPSDSPWASYKTQYKLYERAHTPWEWFPDLFRYSIELGLIPFTSVFDETSVDFIESIGVSLYKLASVEINHLPLIEKIANTGKPLIISLGVASELDLKRALNTFYKSNPKGEVAILHCDTSYPAPIESTNLAQIVNLQEKYNINIGFSDHTQSLISGACAVMLGARIVEKHITLKSSKDSPDSFFSFSVDEFSVYVKNIRSAEKLFGKKEFRAKDGAEKLQLRRSIYPCKKISKGSIVKIDDLKIIRPGFSLSPEMIHEIVGKKSTRNIDAGDRIQLSDFE